MDEDSPSDWDSMSEAVPNNLFNNDKGQPSIKEEKADDKTNSVSPRQSRKVPPFDFSKEVGPKSKSVRASSPPGKAKPKTINAYKPSTQANMDQAMASSSGTKTRFQSPASSIKREEKMLAASPISSVASSSGNATTVHEAIANEPEPKKKKDLDSKTKKMPRQDTLGTDSGLDNPAFQDLTFEIEEKGDSDHHGYQPTYPQSMPKPDETIQIWTFEDPIHKHFQVSLEPGEVFGDKLLPDVSLLCTWCLSECFGLLKVPFVILFLILGQVIMFVINALLKPLVDFVLKPLLVSCHNLICLPFCGLFRHSCQLLAHSVQPLCELCQSSSRAKSESAIKEM